MLDAEALIKTHVPHIEHSRIEITPKRLPIANDVGIEHSPMPITGTWHEFRAFRSPGSGKHAITNASHASALPTNITANPPCGICNIFVALDDGRAVSQSCAGDFWPSLGKEAFESGIYISRNGFRTVRIDDNDLLRHGSAYSFQCKMAMPQLSSIGGQRLRSIEFAWLEKQRFGKIHGFGQRISVT